MASDIVDFGKIKEKKEKMMRRKITEYVAFLQALSCKFISNLIKRRISSIYLNFGNLLKEN